VSAICGILRGSLDDYLADRLPAAQRRILREHLAACDACRGTAAGRDASFLFARPLVDDVGPAETAAILASVRAGVAHLEAERRISRPSRRRAAVAAAAAAVALLVLTVEGGSSRREATEAREARVAALPAATPAPARASAPVSGGGLEAAGLSAETAGPPSNATVYDLNPGAGREEPRVVWIVDRGLDI
jgi:Putative zinc-finger